VYSSSDLKIMTDFICKNNEFLIKRFDNYVIDGKEDGMSSSVYSSCINRERASHNSLKRVMCSAVNPYAMAQFINHSKNSNVMSYGFDFPPHFPSELCAFIPNVSFQADNDEEKLVRSLVMVSLRTINCNEELFLDYRFSEYGNLPSWYK